MFERLRSLRSEIARQEAMLEVSGVGEHKFEKYGEQFLKEINAYTGWEKEKLYFGDLTEAGQYAGEIFTDESIQPLVVQYPLNSM